MKIITTLQNGQPQVAEVTWEEFQTLNFKYENSKTLQIGATSENVEYIKVYFNKKGEVVDYKAILKAEGPTSIFKKEAIKKNGQLTKRAITILKEVAK